MSDLRKVRGEETRQKLLLGAFELVANEGFPGLTAGKLAKFVGVSKSTIFHHFASLDLLASEAMFAWIDGIMAPIEGRSFGDLEEYLRMLGGAVLVLSSEGEKYYRASMAFYHKSLCDEELRKSFAAFMSGYLDREREILAGLTGLPEGGAVLVEYTTLLGGALDGLVMQMAMTRDVGLCQAAWLCFSKMFAAALRAEQATEGVDRDE